MNYIAYTARFLYRIKWWLILAPTVVALAVFFKSPHTEGFSSAARSFAR